MYEKMKKNGRKGKGWDLMDYAEACDSTENSEISETLLGHEACGCQRMSHSDARKFTFAFNKELRGIISKSL
jgi:hypothetical protein